MKKDELDLLIEDESTEVQRAKLLFTTLPDRKKMFVNAMIREPIKAKAARAAGCTMVSSRTTGMMWARDPVVKEILGVVLRTANLDVQNLIDRVTTNAHANLSQYLRKERVFRRHEIQITADQYIDKLEARIERLYYEKSLPGHEEDRLKVFDSQIKNISNEIKMAMYDKKYRPDKVYLTMTEPQPEDVAVLDSARLVGTEDVQITSVSYDRNGQLKVKIAKPEDAQDKLSRYEGLYEKDNRQKATIAINIAPEDDELGMEIATDRIDEAEEVDD